MVKRTQNVRIFLNEFHHFVGLPFKGLRLLATTPKSSTSVSSTNRNNLFVWNLHSLNLMSHLLIQNLLVCLFHVTAIPLNSNKCLIKSAAPVSVKRFSKTEGVYYYLLIPTFWVIISIKNSINIDFQQISLKINSNLHAFSEPLI